MLIDTRCGSDGVSIILVVNFHTGVCVFLVTMPRLVEQEALVL